MDLTKPTALFIGRYQPFHPGHKALIEEGIRREGQAIICVRLMPPDNKNPFTYLEVSARIHKHMAEHKGKFIVSPIPNISAVYYGRDVGYKVEQIHLDADTEAISGTAIRERKS